MGYAGGFELRNTRKYETKIKKPHITMRGFWQWVTILIGWYV